MDKDYLLEGSCELLKTCNFINIEVTSKLILKEFKKKYCLANKDLCARYMIAKSSGLDSIPLDLYPNEYDKCLELIY